MSDYGYTYIIDDQAAFDAALRQLERQEGLLLSRSAPFEHRTHVPGERDSEHPCTAYLPGRPSGDCQSDGHYVCEGCAELDPRRLVEYFGAE